MRPQAKRLFSRKVAVTRGGLVRSMVTSGLEGQQAGPIAVYPLCGFRVARQGPSRAAKAWARNRGHLKRLRPDFGRRSDLTALCGARTALNSAWATAEAREGAHARRIISKNDLSGTERARRETAGRQDTGGTLQ